MKKNIIIGILTTISILSILFNVGVINYLPELTESDRERSNKAFYPLDLLRTPYNTTISDTDSLTIFASTQDSLLQIEYDLIEITGGINPENGELWDAYSIRRVSHYFYTHNHKRPFAARYFETTINNYLEQLEKMGYESSLKEPLTYFYKHNNSGIFKRLTVAESLLLLELVKNRILIDERRIKNGC